MKQSDQNLATIVTVSEVLPIEGADNIVLVKMKENAWQCVAPKGEFIKDSIGVYFVIDSIVDTNNPALEFMKARKGIVWPCKFKGQLSQGLLIPATALIHWAMETNSAMVPLIPNTDVTEFTNTTKHIRKVDLPNNPDAEGRFPNNIVSPTDELNALSYQDVLKELQDNRYVAITMKMDGSSGTFLMMNGEFRACSRKQVLKPDANNAWNRMAKKYKLADVCANNNVVIQGEVCGPKLNGNRMGLQDEELYVFDIFRLDDRTYMNPLEVEKFCDENGLKSVPIVLHGTFEYNSFDELIDLASNMKYDNDKPAEGIVIRDMAGCWSTALDKRLSVKIINPNYKVK